VTLSRNTNHLYNYQITSKRESNNPNQDKSSRKYFCKRFRRLQCLRQKQGLKPKVKYIKNMIVTLAAYGQQLLIVMQKFYQINNQEQVCKKTTATLKIIDFSSVQTDTLDFIKCTFLN